MKLNLRSVVCGATAMLKSESESKLTSASVLSGTRARQAQSSIRSSFSRTCRLVAKVAARTMSMGALTLAVPLFAHASTYVYVANADSASISTFSLDESNGSLQPLKTVPVGGTVMPMALSPDHLRLYAGLRSKPYRVVSFAVNPLNGDLIELGRAPLAESMAYLSTDATGRHLLSASYGGNLLAVNGIGADGVASDVLQTVPTGPMAHAIRVSPDNHYAFASVLGSDAWLRLRFDATSGHLTLDPQPAYSLPKNSGPRHFVFSSDERHIYLIDELDGKLHMLNFDPQRDTVRPTQTVSILPPDFNGDKPWGADLHLSPDGHFLYISERTSSTLGVYRVNRTDGTLVRTGTYATEKQPRGFNIDPSGHYLLAVGQLSPTMSAYRINTKTGALERIGQYPVGQGANWVEIVGFGSAP